MAIVVERYSEQESIEDLADLPQILQRIYSARGIKNRFDLKTDLSSLLPFNDLKGINQAVELLFIALQTQQRMMIIGDFDADGATSTALAVLALKSFGFNHVSYIVPNRFDYGYGLTPEIVDVASQDNPDVIITVDNGISSILGVEAANAKNIKVLITDHHLTADELPQASAIVNPNQPGDSFGSKNLAGCGVIFYVLLALRSYLREQNYFEAKGLTEPNMAEYLDLVALGTVADVVKLDKNNRILVAQGLKRMRLGHCRPGIKALFAVANRQLDKLVAEDLGFAIGPRLNAAGRLEDMSLGIECLIAEDYNTAMGFASELDALNQQRKSIESEMRDQAFKILDNLHLDEQSLPSGISIFDETWHQGVVGIVASRIKDKYHRPVIAFAPSSETEIKGSARSINGLHIRDTLDAVAKKHPDLISKFGGHAMAAGLSLERKNFEAFKIAFDDQVKQRLSCHDLQQRMLSDGELLATDLNLQLADTLKQSGPWGQGFPAPLFDGTFELVEQRIVGQRHLRLVLNNGGKDINAIAFNVDLKQWPNYRCYQVHIVYRLDINEFNKLQSLQLIVEALKAI